VEEKEKRRGEERKVGEGVKVSMQLNISKYISPHTIA
jgi:hypothetical protein